MPLAEDGPLIEESDSEVEFQDHYSDDDSDSDGLFDEHDQSGFDVLSPEALAVEMGEDANAEIADDEFEKRMQAAVDVICPEVEGPCVPQDRVKNGALRRSSRKRVALLDMEVCRDLCELDTDSDCCSSDERGYSEPGSDSGSGKESSRDVDVDVRCGR